MYVGWAVLKVLSKVRHVSSSLARLPSRKLWAWGPQRFLTRAHFPHCDGLDLDTSEPADQARGPDGGWWRPGAAGGEHRVRVGLHGGARAQHPVQVRGPGVVSSLSLGGCAERRRAQVGASTAMYVTAPATESVQVTGMGQHDAFGGRVIFPRPGAFELTHGGACHVGWGRCLACRSGRQLQGRGPHTFSFACVFLHSCTQHT